MSSVVILQVSEGFIISSDSIAYKQYPYFIESDKKFGKIKTITRKLFQIHKDILVIGLGNWNSYFPLFNAVASMDGPPKKLLDELRYLAVGIDDSKIYIIYRYDSKVKLDIVEGGLVKEDQPGAVMYPDPVLNSIFLNMYESDAAKAVRGTGMLGIVGLVNAYNMFALTLCSDISEPFDTVFFSHRGVFSFKGGITTLPVDNFQ